MGSIAIDAAVVEGAGNPFRFEKLAMDAPGPGQIRVRLHACGICHTDMVMRDGALPIPFPVILGHEGAGVVDAVGPGVDGVAPGDHVLLSFHSCGACSACHDHQPGYCAEFVPRNFLGVTPPGQGGIWRGDERIGGNIFGQSSFATHALAHSDNVVRIDRDLPLDILAPLGCGVQTGAGTVLETLQVQPGQSIAILGAGAVGLSALMAAVIAGAGRIAVIDRHASRLALARELGATETGDDLAALDGQFDHIADTTGVPALLGLAVDRLAQRGTLALVGAYPPGGFTIDPSSIMSMGRRIVGVVEGGIDPQLFIPRLITYYREGRLPLEKLIKRYAFADLEAAFAASESGAVIKPVVLMPQD
ncbi:MAG: NAD(P)-dependent alcohol dehydrogenase [Sphingobium sp.]|uniref:Aryl-alcohol dehydrogenase n=1 Tax=Sphingobium xenophagum TaxID=121428 RepID=A0A249MYP4_SPHXE|nr:MULTISPECIES: NAD(P)-dependent alcohol dehydrogenase [Sphingobium]MBU0658970.1 NAD(P)-dependent alcohol dehydrogenase [Alphaproteobacteria bacterium]ASY46284.1 NAD(P)-dependent alcohol dehydrogenase [Sphingobium xenophagum]MBA4754747.1 NAD(P)-dependent alcohol dehydrogenase [Sphingobium sp.]MBU0869771.1 NAD(P)-dependent alcohol dehydrogenase [Alphaproteobacteria bacterium]MBU1794524.1 NAD(P)-dependent alcohol dehydrogenase [Alphaproteobacteria bacterium]|tara:strand:+ start:827 stop:1912 length:1086 start_codon:yes stop_codon:yes gene_type:complete